MSLETVISYSVILIALIYKWPWLLYWYEMGKRTRKIGSRPYMNYRNQTLAKALNEISSNNMSLRKASRIFNIPLGTLSHKLQKKHGKKHGRPTAFSDTEEAVFCKHIETVGNWGFPFDKFDLRMLAKTYLDSEGRQLKQFPNNFPSNDWAEAFLIRNKNSLTQRTSQNIKRSRAKITSKKVSEYFENLRSTLQISDAPVPSTHIFNYDESNLCDDPGSKKCIFQRGVKYPERVRDSSKISISIMYCGSAAGRVLPPYIVYKAEHLWSTWTEGGPPGVRYNRSRSGWFDTCCFIDWFEVHFLPEVKTLPGKKVLIGDNLSSHFNHRVLTLAQEHEIEFVCLPPNATHFLQPLDVAFFGPLKRSWRKILNEWKQSRGKRASTLTKDAFPRLLKTLQRDLFGETNHSDNLVSGFRKCGIYPFNPKAALERLPDCDLQLLNESTSSAEDICISVSNAVFDILKHLRGVDEEPAKRRKKINVDPGKSIKSTDLKDAQGSGGKTKRKPARPRKRTKIREEKIEVEVDDSDPEGEVSLGSSEEIESHESSEEESLPDSNINRLETEPLSSPNVGGENNAMRNKAAVGQFVIVQYEGQKFPGKIVSLDDEGALVSTLRKCNNVGWAWPTFKDEIDYDWKDVLQCNIEAIRLNNRGAFRVPVLEDEWGK